MCCYHKLRLWSDVPSLARRSLGGGAASVSKSASGCHFFTPPKALSLFPPASWFQTCGCPSSQALIRLWCFAQMRAAQTARPAQLQALPRRRRRLRPAQGALSVRAEKRTVLVTGGAGFVGSHAIAALLRRGADVVSLDPCTSNWPYPAAWKESNLQLLRAVADDTGSSLHICRGSCVERGDVSAALQAAGRVSSVLHLAAFSGVAGTLAEEAISVNVGGTAVVAELARKAGVERFVLASSGAVYGDRGEAMRDVGYSEAHAADAPLSVYAASKRSAELVTHAAVVNGGMCATVLRLFTVYGERGRPDMAPYRFVRDISVGTPLTVYGDGGAWRDYVHVEDVAACFLAAAFDTSREPFRLFNVAGGQAVRLRDFIRAVEAACGKQASLVRLPERAGDVGGTHADVRKALRELGWRPAVSLEEGLRRTAAWWLDKAADEYRVDSSKAGT